MSAGADGPSVHLPTFTPKQQQQQHFGPSIKLPPQQEHRVDARLPACPPACLPARQLEEEEEEEKEEPPLRAKP
jgi:hypothetical protein